MTDAVGPNGLVLPRSTERRPRPHGKRSWSPTMGLAAVLDPDGTVAWQEDEWVENDLANEGQSSVLSVYLAGGANPSKYIALINGGTTPPTKTSTMAYLGGSAGANETQVPAANGYNRQQILTTDWAVDGIIGADERYSAAQKTFGPASGSTWTITHACMVTALTGQIAGSGKFILFLAISASTTIAINQSFLYTLRWTEQ